MPNDDTRLFPSLSWARFNSDFQIPESDDAARVANEVRASVDTWIQNSLAQLEDDMNKRAQVTIGELNNHLKATNDALGKIQSQIGQIQNGLNSLMTTDPVLATNINNLKAQTQAARAAMQQAADDWENHGKDTVSTIESIVGTVAKIAAA